MSEPHCIHLLAADGGLAEGHRYGKYMAVCGALIGAAELSSATCPDGCDSEIVYCLGCIRMANERNYDAGVDVGCPSGVIARTKR